MDLTQEQELIDTSELLKSYLLIKIISKNQYLYEKNQIKYRVEILTKSELIFYEKIREKNNYIIEIIENEQHDDLIIVVFEDHSDPLLTYKQKQKDYTSLFKLAQIVKYLDKNNIVYPFICLQNIYCVNQQYKLKLINYKDTQDLNQQPNVYQLATIYYELLTGQFFATEKNDVTQQQYGDIISTQNLVQPLKFASADEDFKDLLEIILTHQYDKKIQIEEFTFFFEKKINNNYNSQNYRNPQLIKQETNNKNNPQVNNQQQQNINQQPIKRPILTMQQNIVNPQVNNQQQQNINQQPIKRPIITIQKNIINPQVNNQQQQNDFNPQVNNQQQKNDFNPQVNNQQQQNDFNPQVNNQQQQNINQQPIKRPIITIQKNIINPQVNNQQQQNINQQPIKRPIITIQKNIINPQKQENLFQQNFKDGIPAQLNNEFQQNINQQTGQKNETKKVFNKNPVLQDQPKKIQAQDGIQSARVEKSDNIQQLNKDVTNISPLKQNLYSPQLNNKFNFDFQKVK